MLAIDKLTVGDLEANCYLVSSEVSPRTVARRDSSEVIPIRNECIIIDPGDDADFIADTITHEKLKPTAIVLTHGHFDHVLGCLELKLNFGIPIYLHEKDKKLYSSANQSALHWLKKKTLKVPPIDRFIKEGDKIKIGDEQLTVIETPGHTPGSLCLYDGKRNLFTGDTLFKDGVGRTDFSYSRPLQLIKSLDKLKKLPESTIIYPGHGDSAILSETGSLIQSQ